MGSKYRDWIIGIVSFIVGASVVLIGKSFIDGNLGSVADWISGLGSIGAIVAVYYQIKQSDNQYRKDKQSNLLIAAGSRRISSNNGASISFSNKFELYFWGTNSGVTAGSFKFIGICTKKEYLEFCELKDGNEKYQKINNYLTEPLELEVLVGEEKRDFELIAPHTLSREYSVPLSRINEIWPNDKELCIMFMDAVGTLYKKDITNHDKSA